MGHWPIREFSWSLLPTLYVAVTLRASMISFANFWLCCQKKRITHSRFDYKHHCFTQLSFHVLVFFWFLSSDFFRLSCKAGVFWSERRLIVAKTIRGYEQGFWGEKEMRRHGWASVRSNSPRFENSKTMYGLTIILNNTPKNSPAL